MPKLHLVGITPDHRGLVLSEHARAKRGDMVLEIDDRLLEAIEKAQRLRTQDEGGRLASNALPSRRDATNGEGEAVVRLSPREIQQRLRAGESIAAIARSSGTDEAWIRRFAPPVQAEQARIVEQACAATLTKRGAGPSAVPLAQAVAANVIDRAPLTLPEIEAGWGAYQRPEGGWHVTFTFPLRGRRQTAEWEFDVATGELTARNKLAGELGWREQGKKLPQPKPAKTPAGAAKRSSARKAAAEPAPAQKTAAAGEAAATTPTGPTATGGSPEAAESPATGPAAAGSPVPDHSVQELPLAEAKPKKAPAPKRAAAAATEAAHSVVAVPAPPTDLDVVEVVVDLRPLDEDAAREPAPIGSPPAPPGGPPAA